MDLGFKGKNAIVTGGAAAGWAAICAPSRTKAQTSCVRIDLDRAAKSFRWPNGAWALNDQVGPDFRGLRGLSTPPRKRSVPPISW
jgi:hypothetical protein